MTVNYTNLKDKRIILRDAIPLKKPFTLLIEPSSLCNFKCKMCFQSAKEQGDFAKKRSNMSVECFEKIIKQAKEWEGEKFKVLKLSIFGEPFMNKDFCKMLKIAKEANIAERIETTTNASLLTKDICQSMIDYELDYIRVSIYGANDKKHKAVSNSNISLEEIHNNLLMLKKMKDDQNKKKPFIAIKMLDTFVEKENNAFKETFANVADELYLDKPHNWVKTNEDSFIENLYGSDIPEENNGQYACPMPFTTIAVRSNGDVAPCCIDWQGGTIIGDIYDSTIKELWLGNNLKHLQKLQLDNEKHKNVSCNGCEVYKSSHYTRDNIDGISSTILD